MADQLKAKQKGLGVTDVVMLGYGSIIGAGLFVASGLAVQQAGPAVLIAFAIGAVALVGVLTALAEMAAANPAAGGLRTFARESMGPWMGFTVGWLYWASGVATMSTEVTAAALLAHLWLPGTPLWVLTLAFAVLVAGINFMDPRGFGKVEGALSSVKVAALIGFIAIGVWALARGQGAGLHALRAAGFSPGALFPAGVRGVGASLLMVMATYAGVQSVAMAAAETRDPARTVPRAIGVLTVSVILLYLGAFSVLILVLPWNQILMGASPFVQALSSLGLPGLQHVLNFVVLTAALSALNSSLFAISRMLRSLAQDAEAPRILKRSSPTGNPTWAVAGSSAALLVAILISYLMPARAFQLVASASASTAMFSWSIIGLCHLRYRPVLEREGKLVYRAGGFPLLTLASLAIMFLTLLSTPLNPGQVPGLVVAVTEFTLISLVYWLFMRSRAGVPGGRGRLRRVEFAEPAAEVGQEERAPNMASRRRTARLR